MTRYYVYRNDQTCGPFEIAALGGQVDAGTLVCPEGGSDWVAAAEVSDLAELFSSSAPPVTAGPPSKLPSAEPSSKSPPVQSLASPELEERPPDHFDPQLKNLWRICRSADAGLLEEQRKKHWNKYFKYEKEIISAEIDRRSSLSS